MGAGKLGSLDLVAETVTLLFTADSTPQTFNIRFANRNSFDVLVRVAIGTGSSPAAADYVDYDVTCLANGIVEDTGLVATSGEKIWVRSNASNVSVRAHGM